MVIPIGPVFNDYATEVKKRVHEAGFCCDVNVESGETMNKKIRNAQLAQYNFIFGKYLTSLAKLLVSGITR